MSLRLGYHYHIAVHQDEQGRILTPGYQGLFVDSLAARCESFTGFFHSALPSMIAQMDYALKSPNFTWVSIGPLLRLHHRLLQSSQMIRPIKEHLSLLDIMLIRGPSPFLPAITRVAKDLPLALLVVGDYRTGIDDMDRPWWHKEITRLLAHWNAFRQLQAAKRALTIVNSQKLYDNFSGKVPRLLLTKTTTLSEQDFFVRDDTCKNSPIHVLYTGRINTGKGLAYIIEAIAALNRTGSEWIFDLVGWVEGSDPIVDELKALAASCGIGDKVIFHGFKSVGPELFEYYKRADIYVISSLSEGFPRTIWEAMAHSLPVIATRVGSIPFYLKDKENALLIELRSSQQIIDALQQVRSNAALRQTLIRNGRELARENTLERRSEELIHALESWVSEKPKKSLSL